jgi:hypothetical protein
MMPSPESAISHLNSDLPRTSKGWPWWHTSVIPGRKKQKDPELQASLDYIANSRPA